MSITLKEKAEVAGRIADAFGSGDRGTIKEAAAEISDVLRRNFTEESFMDKIAPPLPWSEATPWFNPEEPGITYALVAVEPDYPEAYTYSYAAGAPKMYEPGARYYKVAMNRLITPRYSIDIALLRGHLVRLEDMCADWAYKSILNLVDKRKLSAVNRVTGNAVSTDASEIANTRTGAVQYFEYQSTENAEGYVNVLVDDEYVEISPSSLTHSLRSVKNIIARQGLTGQRLLMNTLTWEGLRKWLYLAPGNIPTIATDILDNGITRFKDKVMDLDIVATIKKDYVQNGEVYVFSDPEFISREYVYTEPQLNVKEEDFGISFYVWAERGGAYFLNNGVLKTKYNDVAANWPQPARLSEIAGPGQNPYQVPTT